MTVHDLQVRAECYNRLAGIIKSLETTCGMSVSDIAKSMERNDYVAVDFSTVTLDACKKLLEWFTDNNFTC